MPVKAFDRAILHRLSSGNAVPLNLAVLLPLEDLIGGKLSPIVADHHIRQSSNLCDLMQLPDTPYPRESCPRLLSGIPG